MLRNTGRGNNPNPFEITNICGATPTEPRCGNCDSSKSKPKCISLGPEFNRALNILEYLRILAARATDPASRQRRSNKFREYCAAFVKRYEA
ncbi:hypothetical protein LTR17_011297 [Elasticomyces elasticus]|nr:hypothetical protein LTR17_011297 [Elasticomyces elasticus]